MDLAGLVSCRDLTAEHADEAVRSLETLRLLVGRLTEIAEPEDGAPKVLTLFARLARGDVSWLEGEVTVEITGNDTRTLIDVFKEEGWGIKERLIGQARFRVPFDEFERAVEISAKRFAPLAVTATPTKLVLSTAANATKSAPPMDVALDENSVGTAPPPAGLSMPREPEPFELPPASEPDPFAPFDPIAEAETSQDVIADARAKAAAEELARNKANAGEEEADAGFGAFIDGSDDPVLAAAIVSPTKSPKRGAPEPPPTVPRVEQQGPPPDPVHTRPTVRRMVAIRPEALRTGRKDPRREEDD